MSNEAHDTLDRYVFGNDLRHFGNLRDVQEVVDFLLKGDILSVDAPDLAILYNGLCLAIEHFEFDSYENNRQGSTNRKEQARIERTFWAL